MIKEVLTKDGSITFFNEDVKETYHSMSGALDEALKKHVQPALSFNSSKDLIVGDLFFGLGYNSIVLMKEFFRLNPDGKLTIFAFENDPLILEKISVLNFPKEFLPYQKLVVELIKDENVSFKNGVFKKYSLEKDNISLVLFLGDINETLDLVETSLFDVVFFDPFSPKKMPEFWTEDFLSKVFSLMKKNSILTTYSCARIVRQNMVSVGFEVKDGPVVGRRSPSTLAFKK